MSDFKALREANFARDREWDPDRKIGLSFRAMELAGEVGELCNMIKKIERLKMGLRGSSPPSMESIADEFGDCQTCLDLTAMSLGIPLWDSTKRKFNKVSEARGLSIYL